jgi:hypothetical protein
LVNCPQGTVRYESPEAHLTHRASAHYQETMVGKIGPLLDRYDVESYEV